MNQQEMQMTEGEVSAGEFLAIRGEAGLHIDAATAEICWWWADVMDPYGVLNLPAEYHCVGREYFARSPESKIWVSLQDIPDETRTKLWQRVRTEPEINDLPVRPPSEEYLKSLRDEVAEAHQRGELDRLFDPIPDHMLYLMHSWCGKYAEEHIAQRRQLLTELVEEVTGKTEGCSIASTTTAASAEITAERVNARNHTARPHTLVAPAHGPESQPEKELEKMLRKNGRG